MRYNGGIENKRLSLRVLMEPTVYRFSQKRKKMHHGSNKTERIVGRAAADMFEQVGC